MRSMRIGYALACLLLLAIEVLIARFVHDSVVRPFVGDVLAVIVLYCGARAVTPLPLRAAALAAFACGCVVEILQGFAIADRLHLTGALRILVGSTFDWLDFVAYGCGLALILWGERARAARAAGGRVAAPM